jgi:bacterial/archaeal transporter family-2 protein
MIRMLMFAVFACVLGGALAAVQAPTNAMLGRTLNSPINGAFVSFLVGALVLGVAALAVRARPDLNAAAALPPYAWFGGVYGAVFVAAAAFAAPRLGVAATMTLFVLGQLAASLAVDHFGGFGAVPRPVSLTRLAGLLLVFGGVVLVRRG